MLKEERHDLELGHGIDFFYTLNRNGNFATLTLHLSKAEFKLNDAEQNVLSSLPNCRRHRKCVSSECVIIRIFRKDLLNVLEIFLEILKGHIKEGVKSANTIT